MSESLTRPQRDELVRRLQALDARLYPGDPAAEPSHRERARLEDEELALLGEYADRLPRVAMSRCPLSGALLRRSFDPFGLDGPWWQLDRTFSPDEPAAPPTFRVLLGALDLRGREPAEVTEDVLPGPDAPFVVPRLLELPGMVAVVSRLTLATGDLAYPVAYFSSEEIPFASLHQFWTRPELWFKTDSGDDGWIARNDAWDFDLPRWIEAGKLWWIEPGDERLVVHGHDAGRPCPYAGLPGERLPQILAAGTRDTDDPPSGSPPAPFEIDEDASDEDEAE
jgi:hypothetical protein